MSNVVPIRAIPAARRIQRIYLTLTLGNTLAASFIWGVNTLFLLDAGLTNFEAFAANAFFTVGMVLFEIPTGVIADTVGRRASYLLGTLTLSVTTALYYWMWVIHAPFWAWAIVSVLLGLGFTFFSGAVEAWLVDALRHSGYEGGLEPAFSKAAVVGGSAMLFGSLLGGVIAQWSDLGVPFILRAAVLMLMLGFAAFVMRDVGFTPAEKARPLTAMRRVLRASVTHGFGKRPVRFVLFAAPFTTGVLMFIFYALQPYLLELWGDPNAYSIAGLAAAIVSGAQILGGAIAPKVRGLFRRRTTAILAGLIISATVLILMGVFQNFWSVIVLMIVWGVSAAAMGPVRQAYLNDMIPSQQRATVLSFDSLLGSAGGVVGQPMLGRAADAYGYGVAIMIGGAIQLIALPFWMLSRREKDDADTA